MNRLAMFFLYLALFCSGLAAQAGEIVYCTDLASASCKHSNVYSDGTGTRYVRTPEQISAALIPAFEKAKPKIDNAIMQGIWSSTPEGKGKNSLQSKAIQAYGLNLDSKSGCQVLAPPDAKIRAEVQALPSAEKTEMIRTCNLRLRELLFEHVKIQSLAEPEKKKVFSLAASAQAMIDLENSIEFKSVLSFVGDEVEKEALKGGLDDRVRALLDDVKKLMIARIRSMGLSQDAETRAVERISKTTYQPGTCSSQLKNARIYDANAFVKTDSEGRSVFSFCPAFLLSTDSEFALVSVMAHEMAHTIDPCRMGAATMYQKKEYDPALETIFDRASPIEPILSCLRSPKSVGAVSCNLEALKRRSEGCGDNPLDCLTADFYKNEVLKIHPCYDDQIVEAVSDWFGAETLEAYMREKRPGLTRGEFRAGVANAFRPLCDEIDLEVKGVPCLSHPAPPNRIERIINANPRLRSRMGCAEKHPKGHLYCDRGPMPQNVLGAEGSGNAPAAAEQSGGIK